MTLLQVAKEAGVSKSAVSDILSGNAKYTYREETVRRVLDTAREFGYRPHSAASLLRSKRTNLIGIFSVNARGGYSTLMTDALIHALRDRPPYRPLFVDVNVLGGKGGAGSFGFEFLEGLFWSLPRRYDDLLQAVVEQRGPGPQIVTVGNSYPTDLPVCGVVARFEGAATEATEHLIELGHERIAILYRAPSSNSPRYTGYRRALEIHGLAFKKQLALPLTDEYGPRSYYLAGRMLTEQLLSLPDPPTAILCHNDEVATGALNAAYRLGCSVPEQLSIVGFDGTPLAEFTTPPLTTVQLPVTEMASAAVDLMVQRLEDPRSDPYRRREFSGTLRIGESSARPKVRTRK
jgi:LacI family transcriptional regulator